LTCIFRHSCILGLLILFTQGCSKSTDSRLSSAVVNADVDNPLSKCPSSPNCYRTTLEYDVPAGQLFKVSQEALKDMGASQIEANKNEQFISAVFTIWLFRFKDDFTLQVEKSKSGTGSYLHVRSASRKGYSDLGVNRHRVSEFVKKIESKLDLDSNGSS